MKKLIKRLVYPIWIPWYLNNMSNSMRNPKRFYGYCQYMLSELLPKDILAHRQYFQEDRRSFGENAFVTMWYILYEKYGFNNFLEIGVYRGQILSLMSLLAKIKGRNMFVTGISPLENVGDSVSSYPDLDYEADILGHFTHFKLPPPNLIKEYSTSEKSIEAIRSKEWDCVYIDGSHDYEIVKQDFLNCYPYLKTGGVMVFDDSSLNISDNLFSGQFKGHPGPSRVVDELVIHKMKEIMRVGHNRCFLKTQSN